MIINEMENWGAWFHTESVIINIQFFAEDGLLLSGSVEEAADNIKIITDVSKEDGPDNYKQEQK